MAGYTCGCGAELKSSARQRIAQHERTNGHLEWAARPEDAPETTVGQDAIGAETDHGLSAALIASIDGIDLHEHVPLKEVVENPNNFTPQTRAKITRFYFGLQGWPSDEQPLSVAEFLEQNKVPIKPPARPVLFNPPLPEEPEIVNQSGLPVG